MKKPKMGKKPMPKMGKSGKGAPSGTEMSFGKMGGGKVTDRGVKK